jgi:hypothetical protein
MGRMVDEENKRVLNLKNEKHAFVKYFALLFYRKYFLCRIWPRLKTNVSKTSTLKRAKNAPIGDSIDFAGAKL